MQTETSIMNRLVAKLENDARNELQSVMGMLQLIAEDPLTRAQQDYLRACRSSADRLLRTVQNVVTFAGPKTAEPRMSEFNLEEAVAGVASIMEVLAERKGLSLTREVHSGQATRIVGDREGIEDVLFRILDNAISFTDVGSICLTMSAAPVDSQTLQVELAIRDTGPGIPADVIARLSDPLLGNLAVQGLGLPIVRMLVLGMGGELSIGSQAGGGSRVLVSLPLRAVPASLESESEHGNDDSLGHSKRQALNVLVAEDCDDSYFVLEAYLKGQEHRLTRAVDGARAVEIFKTGRYDLVLMDIHMPVMDGYAATNAIREWETGRAHARTPIVVLSSDSPGTQIHNGARVGCSGYLTKPVSKEALLCALRRYARADVPE